MNWTDAELLRVCPNNADNVGGETAFDELILAARKERLAGATATQHSIGFCSNYEAPRTSHSRPMNDFPVIAEIVDVPDHIEDFVAVIQTRLPPRSLVTRQHVRMLDRRETQHDR